MKLLNLLLISLVSTLTIVARASTKDLVPLIKEQKAVLVDVREPDEIKEGKIKGAQIFSSSKMNTAEWEAWAKTLPKDKDIYLYCRSGRRAERMAEALRAKGLKAKGAGGFNEWVEAGAESTK